jgi:hypothetical protein
VSFPSTCLDFRLREDLVYLGQDRPQGTEEALELFRFFSATANQAGTEVKQVRFEVKSSFNDHWSICVRRCE